MVGIERILDYRGVGLARFTVHKCMPFTEWHCLYTQIWTVLSAICNSYYIGSGAMAHILLES